MTTSTHGEPDLSAALVPIKLRRQFVAEGYSDRAIKRLLNNGEWQRLRWGAYAPTYLYQQLDRCGQHVLVARAALLQAKTPASLSHSSALAAWQSPDWGLDLSTVHLTRHDGRSGRREAGIQQHTGLLKPNDLVLDRGVSMTSPTRAALEFTTIAGVEESLVMLNHLLHHNLTTPELLRSRYESMTNWPATLTTDLSLRLADGRIESVGETRTFYVCYICSLPLPVPQYVVRDRWGNIVAILDFAWPELGKWLEFDGKIKYEKLLRPGERASDVVVREKRREDLVRQITGWSCHRLMYQDLNHPRHTGASLRRFLFPR